MNRFRTSRVGAAVMTVVLGASSLAAFAQDDAVAKGKAVAEDRKLGNCLACHAMGDGDLAGTIAPPLVMMQQRFPNKADLRAQIADPTVRNSHTTMPPFGKHHILTDDEIDLVVEYVYTL